MKKILKIILYPIYLPRKLSRKFWLWISKQIHRYEQDQIAEDRLMIKKLKIELDTNHEKIKDLKAANKQLLLNLEMLEMDERYI